MIDQLQRYQIEKQITHVEYQAALMFFADHETARQYLRMRRPTDRDGAERYRRACRALGDGRHVMVAVIVDNAGASSWAFENGLRRVDGMTRLRAGLGVLVGVYAREVAEAEAAE